ncbi:hypothetical protein MYX84_10800 [Acidobacteria bacterium AH-259-O06]|nr:hypothetical protein [Acidobacteria bacterium AH-259-O06]
MRGDRFLSGGLLLFGLISLIGCLSEEPSGDSPESPSDDPRVLRLAEEVHDKGWIVYSSRTERGDWDLFLIRPGGSKQLNITNTPDFHEMGGRFSPDGKQLLYRRLTKTSEFHHLNWGLQGQLMIAASDGSDPASVGGPGEYPWASWGPEGKRIACLYKSGIKIYDLGTGQIMRQMNRQGIYQQLFWSANGEDFCGPANQEGKGWGVVCLNLATGRVSSVSGPRMCCTGDWFPDSEHVIYSYRPVNQEVLDGGEMARRAGQKLEHGWTQLWMGDKQAQKRRLVYGEDGRHIYGGAVSPDGRYVLFTRSHEEDLKVLRSEFDQVGIKRKGAPMGLMRISDAPIIGGKSRALRKLDPHANDGPVLQLPECWEPHWTYADMGM